MENWNQSIIPHSKHKSVRFSASSRTHCRENKMNDQREENEHHQIEKFSFVYHRCLLGTILIMRKACASAFENRSAGFLRDLSELT
jgi:hypothetical protein